MPGRGGTTPWNERLPAAPLTLRGRLSRDTSTLGGGEPTAAAGEGSTPAPGRRTSEVSKVGFVTGWAAGPGGRRRGKQFPRVEHLSPWEHLAFSSGMRTPPGLGFVVVSTLLRFTSPSFCSWSVNRTGKVRFTGTGSPRAKGGPQVHPPQGDGRPGPGAQDRPCSQEVGDTVQARLGSSGAPQVLPAPPSTADPAGHCALQDPSPRGGKWVRVPGAERRGAGSSVDGKHAGRPSGSDGAGGRFAGRGGASGGEERR